MTQPQIQAFAERKNFEALRPALSEEIDAFVEATLEAESPDADRLLSLGVTLAKAGHEYADGPALNRLAAKPTTRRVDFVAAFLSGLWKAPFRSTAVDPQTIRHFAAAVRQTPLDDDAAYMSVLALAEVAAAPAETKATVAEALRFLGAYKYQSLVTARLAHSAIEKALQRAGA